MSAIDWPAYLTRGRKRLPKGTATLLVYTGSPTPLECQAELSEHFSLLRTPGNFRPSDPKEWQIVHRPTGMLVTTYDGPTYHLRALLLALEDADAHWEEWTRKGAPGEAARDAATNVLHDWQERFRFPDREQSKGVTHADDDG